MPINWENCYLVQYKPTRNKKMDIAPRGIRAITKIDHPVYDTHFYGAERGTKWGINKLKNTTNWAIVDMTNPDKPVIIHSDNYPKLGEVKVIKTKNKDYIIVQGSNKFFKFYISEHSSYNDMRKNTKRRKA